MLTDEEALAVGERWCGDRKEPREIGRRWHWDNAEQNRCGLPSSLYYELTQQDFPSRDAALTALGHALDRLEVVVDGGLRGRVEKLIRRVELRTKGLQSQREHPWVMGFTATFDSLITQSDEFARWLRAALAGEDVK